MYIDMHARAESRIAVETAMAAAKDWHRKWTDPIPNPIRPWKEKSDAFKRGKEIAKKAMKEVLEKWDKQMKLFYWE